MSLSRYCWIIFASFCLALFIIFFNHNPINSDGILYLEVSRVWQTSGWHAAMAIYPWPFYAFLIAVLHQILSISSLVAAFWLNNFFVTGVIVVLLLLLQKQQSTVAVWLWAALLLLCYAQLNQLRIFIIRDPGYWVALFSAFYLLMQYCQSPRWRYVLGWHLAMVMAISFRIEGVVVWLILPFALLLPSTVAWRQRVKQWLMIYSGLIGVGLLFLFWIYHHPHIYLGRLNDLWHYAAHGKSAFLNLFSISLWEHFLLTFTHSFTFIYTLLLTYAWYYRLGPKFYCQSIFYGFLGLNFLIPLFFDGYSDIVTRRYLMPLCLSLLLYLPFAAQHLWQQRNKRYLIYFLILLFSVQTIDGIIPFGYSKAYIVDAGKWLKMHTPPTARIYSNSREILFYANRSTIKWQNQSTPDNIALLLKNKNWQNYYYLAIRINHNDDNNFQQLINRRALIPVKIFTNKRHDKVMIFYVFHFPHAAH